MLGAPGTGKSVIKQALQRLPDNQHLVATVGRTLHTYTNTIQSLCDAFRGEFLRMLGVFKCERRPSSGEQSLQASKSHAGKALTTILDDAHLMDLANPPGEVEVVIGQESLAWEVACRIRRSRARCWRMVCSMPISVASTSSIELPLRAALSSTTGPEPLPLILPMAVGFLQVHLELFESVR